MYSGYRAAVEGISKDIYDFARIGRGLFAFRMTAAKAADLDSMGPCQIDDAIRDVRRKRARRPWHSILASALLDVRGAPHTCSVSSVRGSSPCALRAGSWMATRKSLAVRSSPSARQTLLPQSVCYGSLAS